MAKKSVRTRLPVKDGKTSAPSKKQKHEDKLKQRGSFPNIGICASSEGHEAFKALAENAPDVIFRVDRDLRFVFVNRKVSEFTGIPNEQFFGKTLLELGLPKNFSIYLGKQAQEVFDHRTLNEFEFNFNGAEGLRWFHARIVPEFDNHGNVETALGIAHDITDIKRVELAYREERAFRDSIEKSIRIGITAFDLEGRQSYVNPSFCQMVGWSEEELEGAMSPFVYWPPEEIKNITQVFQQVFSGKDFSEGIELRFRRRNGERFDGLVLFSPLKDSQENVIGWIGSIGDITEHKKRDEEIRKLNFELEQRVIERTAELEAATKKLQESEQKSRLQLAELETIYDSAPVGLCVFDPQLTYLRINKRIAEINGVPAEDHIGRTPWDIVPELARQAEALLRQIIETGQPVLNVEVSGETPAQPGIFRTWLQHWLPLKDAEGHVLGINVVAEEVTDRKRAEAEVHEERDRLAALIGSIRDEIWFADTAGEFTLINPSGRREFKLAVEETRDIRELAANLEVLRPDGTPRPVEETPPLRALRGETVTDQEEIIRMPGTGELRYRQVNATPVYDASGKIIGSVSVVRDITERKHAEMELERMRVLLAEGQRIAHVGSFEYIAANGETIWSDEEFRIYGLKPGPRSPNYDDLMQKHFHPDDASRVDKQFAATLQSGSIYEIEHRIVRPDGSVRDLYNVAQPYFDEQGKLVKYIGATLDITEQKRVEHQIRTLNEDLKRRAAELENANKELEAFTYTVSHDLKTPLIVASGFCKRLSERYGGKLGDKGFHYLQRIQESCHHMNLLIEDLLDLSKVTTSKMRLQSIDLSDIVNSIATRLKETEPSREVSFFIEDGLTAKGDSRLLKVALENLIGNAWKFTSKRKRPKIEFGLTRIAGDEPTYFVRDNGCGFDMSMMNKLFQPFQRFHSDEEFSGTGIGLATVHRIITRHEGRIWAKSAVGKGSTFFFTLPF